jgi:tetratricopeptide (TPR) repeat protein
MHRPNEAMVQIERALKLDPFNVTIHSFYAVDLLFMRRYDEAIAAARAALRMQPDAPVALFALYQALYLKGMYDELLSLDRKTIAGDQQLEKAFERGYAESGYPGAQGRVAEVYASRIGKSEVQPLGVSFCYLYAGNRDRTLEWLEKAFEARDPNMPYLGLPVYDSLRSDPRFQSLIRRMNLPQ